MQLLCLPLWYPLVQKEYLVSDVGMSFLAFLVMVRFLTVVGLLQLGFDHLKGPLHAGHELRFRSFDFDGRFWIEALRTLTGLPPWNAMGSQSAFVGFLATWAFLVMTLLMLLQDAPPPRLAPGAYLYQHWTST